MEIDERQHGAVTVLRPRGPILEGDADGLVGRSREAWEASLGRFVLDASEVAYVDSRGLEALVEVTEMLSASGHALKLCGATETLRETLALTGLSGEFEHYEDVQVAVRSFV